MSVSPWTVSRQSPVAFLVLSKIFDPPFFFSRRSSVSVYRIISNHVASTSICRGLPSLIRSLSVSTDDSSSASFPTSSCFMNCSCRCRSMGRPARARCCHVRSKSWHSRRSLDPDVGRVSVAFGNLPRGRALRFAASCVRLPFVTGLTRGRQRGCLPGGQEGCWDRRTARFLKAVKSDSQPAGELA